MSATRLVITNVCTISHFMATTSMVVCYVTVGNLSVVYTDCVLFLSNKNYGCWLHLTVVYTYYLTPCIYHDNLFIIKST